MGANATIRAIALNVGDTSLNDTGVSGYLDNVVVKTSNTVTTYDFDPDTTVPTVSNIKMFVNGQESTFMRPGDTVKVQATVADPTPGSGINPAKVRLLARSIATTDGGYIDSGYFVNTSGNTYERTFTFPVDGKYIDTHKVITQDIDGLRFYIKAYDNANNYTNSASKTFTNDKIIPEMQNIKLYVKNGSGTYATSSYVKAGDQARVEVEASDAASGVKNVEFRIQDASSGAYVAPRVYEGTPVGGNTYRYDFTVPADAKYINTHGPISTAQNGLSFWARAYDNVGNYGNGTNTNGLSGNFTLDSTGPSVNDIVLNGQAVDPAYVRSANCQTPTHFYTVNGTVDLQAVLTDTGSGVASSHYKVRKLNASGCTLTSVFSSNYFNLSNVSGHEWAYTSGFDTTTVPSDGE